MDAQAKLELNNAYEMYRQRENADTATELRQALGRYFKSGFRGLADFGPCLGMLVTLVERHHVPRGWRLIAARLTIWVLSKALGAPIPPRRPGWNDYYMVRWQLTKEQRWADEIHRRTHYRDDYMVGFTANWMANSQREEDKEFDEALRKAEIECGCVKAVA